jgi:hypothetical protein
MRLIHQLLTATFLAAGLLVLSFGGVLGHSQTVTPPGIGEAVVQGPISNPWAQAHCTAAAPGVVADSSNGVVQFLPAAALPCPLVPNPGGEIHGD